LRRSAKHTERSFAEASRGGKIETMAQQFRSVPDIVLRSFDRAPRTDCLVWKADGDWREASSAQVQECILEVAAGLRRLGVAAGDRVGILVPSSVWWLQFDLGALFLGAVTVPLFDNLSEEHFRFETSDAGIGLIFVADAAQRALVRRVGPEGIRIVTLEPGDPDGCTSLESLRAGHAREDLDRIRREAEGVAAADLATLIYTSGSTGSPKGVEITHGALAFQVGAVFERYPLDPARDVCLTCLPLAHVFERMVVLYHLAAGVRLVFAENVQAVGEAMRQQRPTVGDGGASAPREDPREDRAGSAGSAPGAQDPGRVGHSGRGQAPLGPEVSLEEADGRPGLPEDPRLDGRPPEAGRRRRSRPRATHRAPLPGHRRSRLPRIRSHRARPGGLGQLPGSQEGWIRGQGLPRCGDPSWNPTARCS
jgi:hypothetical protein